MSSPDPREQRLADRDHTIAELRRENAWLRGRLAEALAKLGKNSTNSHQPPSSDKPGVVRGKRKSKGKTRGGQPGHEPKTRELIDPRLCRKVVSHLPHQCGCGSTRFGPFCLRSRHQVIYLPELKAPVDEHQSYGAECLDCGHDVVEPIPPEYLASAFGPCVTALVADLSGEFRVPKRSVQTMLQSFFGIDISLGAIIDQEQDMATALGQPYAEAHEELKQGDRANADETSWRQDHQKAWLWVAVGQWVTVFLIHRQRSGAAARELLGAEFDGVLGTDRWVSYETVDALLRQLCWAHLIRDFLGWTLLEGDGGRIGRSLLRQSRKMFRWWSQVKDGTLTRRAFQRRMKPVQQRIISLLRKASVCPQAKVAGMAWEILGLEYGLFTFVEHEGVEPTNNQAERALRHAVVWRKICGGTASERGSRFVERILTTVATLKQQGRDVRDFLTQAIRALRFGLPPPSLLPAHH